MKHQTILLLTTLTAGLAFAAPPETFRADRYKDLYLNSPITDPPLRPETPEEEPSDLPDWTLVAVGKNRSGRPEVRIMNMKDRTRITIPGPDATEAGFSIVDIVNSRNYLADSVVTLRKGGVTGEVRFDKKFLVLKKVSAPTNRANQQRSNTGGSNKNARNTNSRSGQPPLPGGTRTTGKTGTSQTTRSAVPQPTSSRATATQGSASSKPSSSSSKSSSTKRTRYVPRPKSK